MSKSYKKFPIVRQDKFNKKEWNRKVRRLDIDYSLKGNQYKKVFINFNSWKYPWFLEEAIEQYQNSDRFPNNEFPTLESWIEYWKNCCRRK